MNTVYMFVTSWCPYCKQAFSWMEELTKDNPKYSEVDIKIIDEESEPETAKKYNYYYVPTYFVNEVKFHEGVPSKEIIKNLYEKALENSDSLDL
jgi:thioredoxin 1